MAKRIKSHHPTFKFKVALDSFVKGNVSEVARRYGLNPNQISVWRRELLDKGYLAFEGSKANHKKKLEKKIELLENLIGKKEVEINLLKKYLDFYAPLDGN